MKEDSTLAQLCCFLSGVMRRINAESLDKDANMRFKYMSPEQCAESGRAADQTPLSRHGEMENLCITKKLSPSISSPASRLQS